MLLILLIMELPFYIDELGFHNSGQFLEILISYIHMIIGLTLVVHRTSGTTQLTSSLEK